MFNDQFEREPAAAYDRGVGLFNEFISANYADSTEIASINHFIRDIYEQIYFSRPLPLWKIDSSRFLQIDSIIDTSGLREEFRDYGIQKNSKDSLLHFNWDGDYYTALQVISLNNDPILRYIKDLEGIGGFSFIIATRMLHDSKSYEIADPNVLSRIVFAEIFSDMLKWISVIQNDPNVGLPEIVKKRS